MWTRRELKTNAKKRMGAHYWKSVLAALVLAISIGSISISFNFYSGNISFWKGFAEGAEDGAQVSLDAFEDDLDGLTDDLDDISDEIDDTSDDMDDVTNEIDIAADEFSEDFSRDMSNGDLDAAAEDFSAFMEELDDEIASMVEDGFDSQFFSDMGLTAKEFLRGYFIAMMILYVVCTLIALIVGIIFKILIRNPFELGGRAFFTENHDDEKNPSLKALFLSFRGHYRNTVKILFLRDLYVFLWSLLFMIPGIIKSYEYRMIPYILAENPDISVKEAFEESRRLMSGNKWKSFVLDLSFLGWSILSGLTFNILGIFYTNPYMFQTNAELYFALKEEKDAPQLSDGYEHYKEID